MASGNFSVVISGLKELRDSINPSRINKEIAISVGLFSRQLHNEIKFGIKQTYNTDRNLDTVLIGDTSNTTQFGRNVIRGGLTYAYKPIDLAKFPYSAKPGNINPGARREGMVHSVSVRRGPAKIIYGKGHRGGFAAQNPKYKKIKTAKYGKFGTQMFERIGKPRLPLRLLFGPSLSTMALNVVIYNPSVRRYIDNFDTFIANRINI